MTESKELKMWLCVRGDINIPGPKLAGQSGHAFERLTSHIYETGGVLLNTYREYVTHNTPKIVVKAKNLAALERAHAECKAAGIASYLVTDAGRTVFSEPTITVLALGPCYRDELPKFVTRFQLMKDSEE